MQVRVRLSAGARRTSRTTPRKRTATTEMMGMGQMPDSPMAINRDTGRTAVGPCAHFSLNYRHILPLLACVQQYVLKDGT